jgi:hypothetical protein
MINETINELRPVKTIRQYNAELSQLGNYITTSRSEQGSLSEEWGNHVLLPMTYWIDLAEEMLAKTANNDSASPSLSHDAKLLSWRLSVLSRWRYSQGYYRFDPDVYAQLMRMDLPDKIPASVFMRLPEWCLYIETPNMKFMGVDTYGFYAYLDYDYRDNCFVLRLSEDTDISDFHTVPISLDNNLLIADSIVKHGYSLSPINKLGDVAKDMLKKDGIAKEFAGILSLLLFICSDAPDVYGPKPDAIPQKTVPQKIKGGYKLFAPSAPRLWIIGESGGKAIREYKTRTGDHRTTGSKAPHIRRAHWHGYWRGKRQSESREFFYKWILPMVINSDMVETENEKDLTF